MPPGSLLLTASRRGPHHHPYQKWNGQFQGGNRGQSGYGDPTQRKQRRPGRRAYQSPTGGSAREQASGGRFGMALVLSRAAKGVQGGRPELRIDE